MAGTVTATQGGSVQNGLLLRVMVLTQAAATQNGATLTGAAGGGNIVTTQTGSRVYGATLRAAATANTADSGCTLLDDVQDATHVADYSTWKTTALTGTPGSTLVGCAAGAGVAALEVLTAGTLTEDGSAPTPGSSTTTATTLTSGSFTPPAGSLVVALVSSDGAGSVTTMTVSDTGLGLTWTEKVKQNPAGSGYQGVWTAPVPAAAGLLPQQLRARTPAQVAAPGESLAMYGR